MKKRLQPLRGCLKSYFIKILQFFIVCAPTTKAVGSKCVIKMEPTASVVGLPKKMRQLRLLSRPRWGTTLLTGLITTNSVLFAQQDQQSIHVEQSVYYQKFGQQKAIFYDSLSGFRGQTIDLSRNDCLLNKVVFGFHPYWAGSDYLNYQWNLISDFCYFSYEVDPSTGDPVTYHDWLTDPAIDSAQAHDVNVHLCATIFSGHTAFFTNPAARQNLVANLVDLVKQRNAHGINVDIELLPSSMSDSVTVFMRDLSVQFKTAIPGALVSICLPAVDWDQDFQLEAMSDFVDFFFVMGYDYYWNGSDQAGPVSPLYSLTPGYNYSLARTISAYETAGMQREKFILGIPYYGRKWKTQSDNIPSPILANGTAVTYANVRNNGSTYSPDHYHWELNSFSSCYIFYQNSSWYQCFIGLDRDLREKYDLVNYRGLAGIGIWALGYDDGYLELWQAISDNFTDCYIPPVFDTIVDSGGPTWNYYADEDYSMTIDHGYTDTHYLTFTSFGLEDAFDSIWLYAGPDATYPMIGAYSGTAGPSTLSSQNGAFTLKFKSGAINNFSGWSAVFHDGTLGIGDQSISDIDEMLIYPNPAKDFIKILLPENVTVGMLLIHDYSGRLIYKENVGPACHSRIMHIGIENYPTGLYSVEYQSNNGRIIRAGFIKVIG